jgi:hypothetical protein
MPASSSKIDISQALLNELGFVQSGALSTATALSAIGTGVPAGAQVAEIQADGGAVRWRMDGTSPTISVGMRIPQDVTIQANFLDLENLEVIGETAAEKVNITYYAYATDDELGAA